MKDQTLKALKDARDKCARTVDKSTLDELDKAILVLRANHVVNLVRING
ncbi:hypothetical protein P4S73_02085 [Paraglaciecola sp. Hal342]